MMNMDNNLKDFTESKSVLTYVKKEEPETIPFEESVWSPDVIWAPLVFFVSFFLTQHGFVLILTAFLLFKLCEHKGRRATKPLDIIFWCGVGILACFNFVFANWQLSSMIFKIP